MEIEKFIEKEEELIDGKKFLISCIPAVQAQELYGKIYKATEDVGDLGMTFLPTSIAVKILSYAAIKKDDGWYCLDSEEVINEQVSNVVTLIKLEAAMIRKNFGFLFDGRLQDLLVAFRKQEVETSEQVS